MIQDVQESVRKLHDQLRERDLTLVTAESCTGGMLGGAITDVPGSSDVYEGGVVSYSNRLKRELLGVSGSLLRAHGAVSAPVARAMAEGVRERLQAKVSLSITGIAGPGGGTPEKPVGLVFVGWSLEAKNRVRRHEFEGDRRTVRRRSVKAALRQLLNQL